MPTASPPTLAQALRGPDPLREVAQALANGANPRDPRVLAAWLSTPSMWSDARVWEQLLGAGLDAARAWEGPSAKALDLVAQMDNDQAAAKLDWLLDAGAPPQPLATALARNPASLGPGLLAVFARTLDAGARLAPGLVEQCALDTEDTPRCLVLARRGMLDPNAPLRFFKDAPGQQETLTYAQALLLYSRADPHELDLDAWRALGADFTAPMANGRLPATALLAPTAFHAGERAPPIPAFRVPVLEKMVQLELIDWHRPDGFDHTPLQCLNALSASLHPAWKRVEQACLRQALEQRLHADLPHPPPVPSPPLLRL